MIKIENSNIYLTRGDSASINITIQNDDGSDYEFQVGDKIIFSVKNKYSDTTPLLRKEIETESASTSATISLTKQDTTIGKLADKPVKYVYDIALNEDQTVIGYDDEGSKYFTLYPEASNDN